MIENSEQNENSIDAAATSFPMYLNSIINSDDNITESTESFPDHESEKLTVSYETWNSKEYLIKQNKLSNTNYQAYINEFHANVHHCKRHYHEICVNGDFIVDVIPSYDTVYISDLECLEIENLFKNVESNSKDYGDVS